MESRANHKTVWNNKSTDESSYNTKNLALPVLPFNPKTVDLSRFPSNAQEYLEQVITERLLTPKVVSSRVSGTRKEVSQSNIVQDRNVVSSRVSGTRKEVSQPNIVQDQNVVSSRVSGTRKEVSQSNILQDQFTDDEGSDSFDECYYNDEEVADDDLDNKADNVPSPEWVKLQVTKFKKVRYYMQQSQKTRAKPSSKFLPFSIQNGEWHALICAGNDTSNVRPFDVVLQLDQDTMGNLILYIKVLLKRNQISVYKAASWLYVLLAAFNDPFAFYDRPTIPEALQAIADICFDTRKKRMNLWIDAEKNEMIACNILLSLIKIYYRI